MSQEAASPPRADSAAANGIHLSPAASFSSTGSCSDGGGGVEEYGSFDDLYEELVLDIICGDREEEEISGMIEDCMLRAASASRAQLRQAAALPEEDRVATEAICRQVAAQRKATRDRIMVMWRGRRTRSGGAWPRGMTRGCGG
jgi:hypothetical protein